MVIIANVSIMTSPLSSASLDPARRLANGSLLLSMRIADPSGSIIFTIMNAEVQDLFEPGDIIKIKNAFTSIHRVSLFFLVNQVL